MNRRIEDKLMIGIRLLAMGFIVGVFALMAGSAIGESKVHKIHGMIFFDLFELPSEIEKTGEAEVILDINSNGGLVDSGIYMMDYMKFKQGLGTTFKCYVKEKAASAAFFILTVCDERYAKPDVQLLWHYISVQLEGQFTKIELQNIIDNWNTKADIYFKEHTLKALDISEEFYHKHAVANTWFTARQLKEIDPKFIELLEE